MKSERRMPKAKCLPIRASAFVIHWLFWFRNLGFRTRLTPPHAVPSAPPPSPPCVNNPSRSLFLVAFEPELDSFSRTAAATCSDGSNVADLAALPHDRDRPRRHAALAGRHRDRAHETRDSRRAAGGPARLLRDRA